MMKAWLIRRPVRRPVALLHHGGHQFIGMQTAFHQHLGLALTGQLHGLGGRVVAVFSINYFVL
jgi:hypothetical protein